MDADTDHAPLLGVKWTSRIVANRNSPHQDIRLGWRLALETSLPWDTRALQASLIRHPTQMLFEPVVALREILAGTLSTGFDPNRYSVGCSSGRVGVFLRAIRDRRWC